MGIQGNLQGVAKLYIIETTEILMNGKALTAANVTGNVSGVDLKTTIIDSTPVPNIGNYTSFLASVGPTAYDDFLPNVQVVRDMIEEAISSGGGISEIVFTKATASWNATAAKAAILVAYIDSTIGAANGATITIDPTDVNTGMTDNKPYFLTNLTNAASYRDTAFPETLASYDVRFKIIGGANLIGLGAPVVGLYPTPYIAPGGGNFPTIRLYPGDSVHVLYNANRNAIMLLTSGATLQRLII